MSIAERDVVRVSVIRERRMRVIHERCKRLTLSESTSASVLRLNSGRASPPRTSSRNSLCAQSYPGVTRRTVLNARGRNSEMMVFLY